MSTHQNPPTAVHMVQVAFHLCWVAACRCGWSTEAGNHQDALRAACTHAGQS
jgi:hypothetical protein